VKKCEIAKRSKATTYDFEIWHKNRFSPVRNDSIYAHMYFTRKTAKMPFSGYKADSIGFSQAIYKICFFFCPNHKIISSTPLFRSTNRQRL